MIPTPCSTTKNLTDSNHITLLTPQPPTLFQEQHNDHYILCTSKQSQGCACGSNAEILTLNLLQSGANLKSASTASCKTAATTIDCICLELIQIETKTINGDEAKNHKYVLLAYLH